MSAALALLASAVLIGLLCLTCPKRRRATRRGAAPPPPTRARLWLALAACLPGAALAGLGESAAFLIWLGGSVVIGWACAVAANPRAEADAFSPGTGGRDGQPSRD